MMLMLVAMLLRHLVTVFLITYAYTMSAAIGTESFVPMEIQKKMAELQKALTEFVHADTKDQFMHRLTQLRLRPRQIHSLFTSVN